MWRENASRMQLRILCQPCQAIRIKYLQGACLGQRRPEHLRPGTQTQTGTGNDDTRSG